jgi:hypothetical protein
MVVVHVKDCHINVNGLMQYTIVYIKKMIHTVKNTVAKEAPSWINDLARQYALKIDLSSWF